MADTVNLNSLTDLNASQRAGTTNLLNSQSTADSDYLKKYTDFLNSQEGASAMAGRIGGELGIPTLQANATMLRNTLTNLPSTYSKAMTGYDVNANQLSRVIGQKSSELSPMVTTAENSLQNAQSNLNTQMGYEQTDQAKQLLPYQTEKDLLTDRQARETTLYSQDNQNELNGLISKLNMGITLSEGEKNRANALAVQEASYQNQLKLAQYQTSVTPAQTTQPNTQVIESGGQKYLIDSGTGKIISKYGTATSSGIGNVNSYFNNTGSSNSTTIGGFDYSKYGL